MSWVEQKKLQENIRAERNKLVNAVGTLTLYQFMYATCHTDLSLKIMDPPAFQLDHIMGPIGRLSLLVRSLR
jgi:hypothetical protein